VKRIPAVLIGTMLVATLGLAVACGDDDPQPQIGEGPADNVDGDWEGTYVASDGSQNGTLCLSFDQDGRGITGEVSFDDGEAVQIGGVITESTLVLAYGAGLESPIDAALATDIAAGGTLNGTVGEDGEAISGTWIAAASVDVHGDWTATKLSQFEHCE
jgi:hypothetical protein